MPSPLTEAPQPGLADSAAELDPAILAAIERELKTSVSDVPPALVAHAVAVSKKCGNEAFCAKRFTDACKFYTQAIAGAPGDKNLRSNRSAAYLALGDYEAALSDAIRCVALDQNWPKAHYRLGKALAAMGEWHAAAATLERCARLITGVGLVPASKDTNTVSTAGTADTTGSTAGSSTDEPTGSTFNEPSTQTDSTIDTKTLEGVLELLAIAKCESEDARSRLGAHETGRRKDLASRLRAARRADDREATLARYVQGLSRIPTPTVYCHVWSAVTQGSTTTIRAVHTTMSAPENKTARPDYSCLFADWGARNYSHESRPSLTRVVPAKQMAPNHVRPGVGRGRKRVAPHVSISQSPHSAD